MQRVFRVIGAAGIVAMLLWLCLAIVLRAVAPAVLFQTQRSNGGNYGVTSSGTFLTLRSGEKIEVLVIPTTKSATLSSDEGRHPVPWFDRAHHDTGVLLYLHGNVGRLAAVLIDASRDVTVISPAYPGYSGSSGEPSEENILETAEATMRWLLREKGYRAEDITVMGHSMGGYPAVYLATRYPKLREVILMNTFSSMQDVCTSRFLFFCAVGGDFFNTLAFAPRARAKIRQFHLPDDDIIPFSSAKKLFDALGSSDKTFTEFTEGTHERFPVETVLQSFPSP